MSECYLCKLCMSLPDDNNPDYDIEEDILDNYYTWDKYYFGTYVW